MASIFDYLGIERPFSKFEALVWLELQSAEGGVLHASADTLADAWGWSRSTTQRFLSDLAQTGMIGLKCGPKSGPKRKGRNPTLLELKWEDRGLLKSISSGPTPPSGIRPQRGLVSPPEGEKQTPPRLAVVEGLRLDETANLGWSGDHIKLTHRQIADLERDFPGANIRAVARVADTKYPRRMNKKHSPYSYLVAILDGQNRDATHDRREREEKATDPANDPRVIWRQHRAQNIRQGVWNDHLWGPLPWLERTLCPVGTFSREELDDLRAEFDAEIARKIAEEERQDAEIAERRAGRARDRA